MYFYLSADRNNTKLFNPLLIIDSMIKYSDMSLHCYRSVGLRERTAAAGIVIDNNKMWVNIVSLYIDDEIIY